MAMPSSRNLRVLLGLFLCLSLPSLVKAQFSWQVIEYSSLTGGLNDTADPSQLPSTEASDLQNIVLTTFGGIAKRDGFSRINSTAIGSSATATGGAFYKQADGTRFLVAIWSNGGTDTIRKMDYGAGTSGPDSGWDDITGTLSVTVADDDLADFAVAENEIVIEDGVNTTAPYKWTGTGNAVALGGTPPNSTMVEYHKRIMWVAGSNTLPSRVQFSNLDDMEIWTSTDTLDIETGDGQTITALKSALDCLYVFKQESIFRICGTNRDDFTTEQMVRGIGAANNQAVTVINNQFVFMTHKGDVAVYDGGVIVQIISAKIETTLTGLNLNRINRTVTTAFDEGTGDEDFYACVSDTGNSTHNLLLVYDTLHKAWLKHSGINCNALWVYEVGTQQRALAFSGYTGIAYRYPSGITDDGTAINAYYMTGHLALGVPQQKIFRRLQPIFVQQSGSTNLTVETRVNFEGAGTTSSVSMAGSGAVWNTAVFDTDAWADLSTTLGSVDIQRSGNFIAWRVSNANPSEPFLVRGVRLYYEPTERVD